MGLARSYLRSIGRRSSREIRTAKKRATPIIDMVERLTDDERAKLAAWAAKNPSGVLTPEVLKRILSEPLEAKA